MIICPKPGDKNPWDTFSQSSKPNGGIIDTIINILTGGKKSGK